ncbi:hypothetical protein IEQ34_008507 [Dendrobium chrysotoxum]|uniref:CBM-cenC domain-containing protein n=1 Tax=Dendrobium chrysotoxum TaxID=161865 RepID=A0AAV7GWR9_DENCH|nr:hypothetical protein IEQ34_008507 [Dendrobium chrysotoxum]
MEGETISVGPWGSEEGTPFCHKSDGKLQKVVLGYEGGFKSLCVKYSTSSTAECMNSNELIKVTSSSLHSYISSLNFASWRENQQEIVVEGPSNSSIVKNADFSQGIEHWRRNWDHCQAEVVSSPGGVGCHYNYAIVTRRREFWHSIEQDITREVYVGAIYDVSAHVSVKGGDGNKFQMTATIRIDNFDSSSFFLHVGRY